MSYPCLIDVIYYTQKYNISDKLNKKDISIHYYKIGKKMGYFPNIMAEKYYCQLKNFDPVFYAKKYEAVLQNLDPLTHWKRKGYKNNNNTCECEETLQHLPNCKCMIKENVTDTNVCYENKCHMMIASLNNDLDNDIPSITSDTYGHIKEKKKDVWVSNKIPMNKKKVDVQCDVYDFIKADASFISKKNNDNALTFTSYMYDSMN